MWLALAPNAKQLADERDNRLAGAVVEEVPAQRPQQGDTPRAEVRQEVVLAELLALPEHRHAFAHQEGDQVGLQHVPAAAVALREQRVAGLVGIVVPKLHRKRS